MVKVFAGSGASSGGRELSSGRGSPYRPLGFILFVRILYRGVAMENVSLESINKVLESMQKELKDIREHMVDVDSILGEDDYKALVSYRREKKAGKLISHAALKKELGI